MNFRAKNPAFGNTQTVTSNYEPIHYDSSIHLYKLLGNGSGNLDLTVKRDTFTYFAIPDTNFTKYKLPDSFKKPKHWEKADEERSGLSNFTSKLVLGNSKFCYSIWWQISQQEGSNQPNKQAPTTSMIYQKYIPQKPLDKYVESICYIEGNNKGTGLPKIAMSLVFNLEDSFKLFTDSTFKSHIDYKRHWVAGLQTQPTSVESYGVSKMFVVQFNALGAFAFLNDPLHYYTNSYITLDNIYKNEADETWERLQNAQSRREQFILVENFLRRRVLANKFPNQKLHTTIEVLFDKNTTPTIHHICKTLHISRKHLNNLSKEFTGVSPKTLSSLNRLQNTLKIISAYPNEKLTDIAYRLEYFDQAHFIHDFKKLTNLTPNEYASLVEKRQSMKIVPHFIPFR